MPQASWESRHGDFFADCRVLVTGGAGFIGSHLCHVLMALGAHVVVLDDLSGGDPANLDDARASERGQLEFTEGSFLEPSVLARCTEGCRFVFHQGALPSVPRSIEQPTLYQQVNVTGTLNVLEAARAAQVERVIFAASSSAYGDSVVLPKTETMAPLPKSPYAANKLAGEHLIRAYAANLQLDGISLRYFNVFGPRQNANSAYAGVVAAFAKALVNNQAPTIYGDGEQSRDFTYVDNVVHANLRAASNNTPTEGHVINVGCGVAVTVNELAQATARQLGKAHLAPRYEPARSGDVKHSLADLTSAAALIGYEPIVSFEEGLRQTLDWYQRARP